MHLGKSAVTFLILLFITGYAFAGDPIPPCLNEKGAAIEPANNDQVIEWKKTLPNQAHQRARVSGNLTKVYDDHSGHMHIQVTIGEGPNDTVEVIYNQGFGPVPTPAVGMTVQACGDFIQSIAPADGYPASPDGAIVHWVHINPNPNENHASGYIVMNGILCGQDVGGDRPRKNDPKPAPAKPGKTAQPNLGHRHFL